MVERRLSSPEEIAEKYNKVGLVVFVINQDGEVLVVRENLSSENGVRKIKGEFGVPSETSEGDESWEETVLRGLEEEIGKVPLDKFYVVNPKGSFLGESLFVEGVLARVVVLHWQGDKEEVFSKVEDGEVSVVGWQRAENLLRNPKLRQGVRRILQECLDNGAFDGVEGIAQNELLPLSLENLRKAEEEILSQ